jgi:hypothetical protein
MRSGKDRRDQRGGFPVERYVPRQHLHDLPILTDYIVQ